MSDRGPKVNYLHKLPKPSPCKSFPYNSPLTLSKRDASQVMPSVENKLNLSVVTIGNEN